MMASESKQDGVGLLADDPDILYPAGDYASIDKDGVSGRPDDSDGRDGVVGVKEKLSARVFFVSATVQLRGAVLFIKGGRCGGRGAAPAVLVGSAPPVARAPGLSSAGILRLW